LGVWRQREEAARRARGRKEGGFHAVEQGMRAAAQHGQRGRQKRFHGIETIDLGENRGAALKEMRYICGKIVDYERKNV